MSQTKLESFQIMGIKTRTSNAAEMKGANNIGSLWNTFFSEQVAAKIPNRLDDEILGVYFDYESDANGPYSVLVGVRVADGTKPIAGTELLDIPSQSYTKFTTEKGQMPNVVIDTWKRIWETESKGELNRKYTYDFELYDQRAADPTACQVDIFISQK